MLCSQCIDLLLDGFARVVVLRSLPARDRHDHHQCQSAAPCVQAPATPLVVTAANKRWQSDGSLIIRSAARALTSPPASLAAGPSGSRTCSAARWPARCSWGRSSARGRAPLPAPRAPRPAPRTCQRQPANGSSHPQPAPPATLSQPASSPHPTPPNEPPNEPPNALLVAETPRWLHARLVVLRGLALRDARVQVGRLAGEALKRGDGLILRHLGLRRRQRRAAELCLCPGRGRGRIHRR
jgi:hypothetical protein